MNIQDPDHQRLVTHHKKMALWEPLKNVMEAKAKSALGFVKVLRAEKDEIRLRLCIALRYLWNILLYF